MNQKISYEREAVRKLRMNQTFSVHVTCQDNTRVALSPLDRRRPTHPRSIQTRSTIRQQTDIINSQHLFKSPSGIHIPLRKEILASPRTLEIHNLLEETLLGEQLFTDPHIFAVPSARTAIKLSQSRQPRTRDLATGMDSKPYQPRPKRNSTSLSDPAAGSTTTGDGSPRKRHCVSMACVPCRNRRSKVSHGPTSSVLL
jgi:hypothetical protein